MEVANRALLAIENEPIRRQIEVELQMVREAIDQYEQDIVRHQTLDLPAFGSGWLCNVRISFTNGG